MTEAKTYLITITQAEEPSLWLVQTADFPDLLRRVSAQNGGLAKGTIFHFGLDAVQPNNSMNAKLLERLATVPPRDFQLWVLELIRQARVGRSSAEKNLFLQSALDQITREMERKEFV